MARQSPNEPRELVIAGFGGLSIYSDSELRANNTWQQLDNFDLVVDGAIRKIQPATLVAGAFPNPLYQLLEYRTGINSAGGKERLLAVDKLGNLWDVFGSTSTPWSTSLVGFVGTGLIDIPFLGQMQGYYVPWTVVTWQKSTAVAANSAVYRYSAKDGNLYVFSTTAGGTTGTIEPKWPNTGTVADNTVTWTNSGILNSQRFKLNYGILIAHSYPAMKFVEWQYSPGSLTEATKINGMRIGVSQPLTPINVTSSVITPNTNGYAPKSGRAYIWTYYNPNTLHDSSPSPFVGPTKYTNLDNAGVATQLTGSILGVLPVPTNGFSSYQSVYLEIPISALTPTYGDGYTCIRCWATQDGGSTFFLLTQLYDNSGNLITNGDGSIPFATLNALQVAQGWTGFVPLPTPQNAVNTARIFDGTGTVVNLAPDPQNLGAVSWTQTPTTGPMTVVPGDSPTGQAAFEYVGTGAAAALDRFKSSAITVTQGATYAFQGFIDNTAGAGGTVQWQIQNASGGATLLAATQADATAGQVSGTFVGPASKKVWILARMTGVTVTTGAVISWGDPILELGNSVSTTPIVYVTPDSSLTIPAPAALSQQPPPANCLTGAIFANTLFLADHNDPSRLWFSNSGDFNSYGVNSYLQFPTDRSFSIMELIPAYDRMLVSSGREIDVVLPNSPAAGFARFPFDAQHGSLSYRGSIGVGSNTLMLMDAGIANLRLTAHVGGQGGPANLQIGFTSEAIISRPIKPLLDAIQPTTIHPDSDTPGEPIPVVDNKQDLYMLGFKANASSTYMDTIVAMPLRGTALGQFSRITALPGNGQIILMKEVQLPSDRTYGVLALTGDNKVYRMFNGTQDGTITATAVTQMLPSPADLDPADWDTQKIFNNLIIEGNDLTHFKIYVSLDGTTYPYGPFTVVDGQHLIRLGGFGPIRQLTIKFVHSSATSSVPDLSFIKLQYEIQGKTP